jgi:hypothetical protein
MGTLERGYVSVAHEARRLAAQVAHRRLATTDEG